MFTLAWLWEAFVTLQKYFIGGHYLDQIPDRENKELYS